MIMIRFPGGGARVVPAEGAGGGGADARRARGRVLAARLQGAGRRPRCQNWVSPRR